ncbi:transposase, partial [Bowdeniella nasicola]|uniref:transposase n=1 Tax=Bowdeniella nasicola TaxID=208480 RepID=UPI000A86398C
PHCTSMACSSSFQYRSSDRDSLGLKQTDSRPKDLAEGRRIAEKVVNTFHTCQIPEVARLGRTLRRWKSAFLAYFTTGRSSNGGTEGVNGIIELHRRLARGYRNQHNYRLRMLLAADGLTP